MKIIYVHSEKDVETIAEIVTDRVMSVEDALELAGVNMDDYAASQGWDDYDYHALKVIS